MKCGAITVPHFLWKTMRLFISFNFDDEITDEFVRLQRQLKDADVRGNFTKQENLHMTAAFIGEYGNSYENV